MEMMKGFYYTLHMGQFQGKVPSGEKATEGDNRWII
jgi:hypothetical protein